MIVSHRYRFVFIKTLKTAGTSLEVFLSGLCGDEDVVTPFGRAEPGHRPRNHQGFYNHMSASEAIRRLGEELWHDYFTFCFERNPWDKTVSHYWFSKGRRLIPPSWSFSDFLGRGQLPHNLPLYARQGIPLVDFIGKYESLEQDLATALGRIGVTVPIALPCAKRGYRSQPSHYSSYFDDASRDFVAQQFAAEIALHGYRFESSPGIADTGAVPARKA